MATTSTALTKKPSAKTILGKPSVQTEKNTVTQSISFERPIYDVMEKVRAKTGPDKYRSVEIGKALEFYYAFYGKLPKFYPAMDPRNVDDAVKAARLLNPK